MELGERNSVLIERMPLDAVAPIGQLTARFPGDGGGDQSPRICRTIAKIIARGSRTEARGPPTFAGECYECSYAHLNSKLISKVVPGEHFSEILTKSTSFLRIFIMCVNSEIRDFLKNNKIITEILKNSHLELFIG